MIKQHLVWVLKLPRNCQCDEDKIKISIKNQPGVSRPFVRVQGRKMQNDEQDAVLKGSQENKMETASRWVHTFTRVSPVTSRRSTSENARVARQPAPAPCPRTPETATADVKPSARHPQPAQAPAPATSPESSRNRKHPEARPARHWHRYRQHHPRAPETADNRRHARQPAARAHLRTPGTARNRHPTCPATGRLSASENTRDSPAPAPDTPGNRPPERTLEHPGQSGTGTRHAQFFSGQHNRSGSLAKHLLDFILQQVNKLLAP